jgi:hypothetical protein
VREPTGLLVSGPRRVSGSLTDEDRRPWIQAIAAAVLEDALGKWAARDGGAADAEPSNAALEDGTVTVRTHRGRRE